MQLPSHGTRQQHEATMSEKPASVVAANSNLVNLRGAEEHGAGADERVWACVSQKARP